MGSLRYNCRTHSHNVKPDRGSGRQLAHHTQGWLDLNQLI